MKKVPVQKGKIKAAPPVMQQMTTKQTKSVDKKGDKLKRSGMVKMKKMSPKC